MPRHKSLLASFRHAFRGVLVAYRSQKHFRLHCVAALLALVAGLVCRLSRLELLLLLLSITLVLLAELLNTALETAVDLVTMEYHRLARVAKDVAAGAVLVTAFNALLVGAVLFLDPTRTRTADLASLPLTTAKQAVPVLLVGLAVLLLLLAACKLWQRRDGGGGGAGVSSHAAIGTYLGTCLILLSRHPLVAVLAGLLALLLLHSRLEAGDEPARTVLMGALLGVLVPVVLQLTLPAVLHFMTPGTSPGTVANGS